MSIRKSYYANSVEAAILMARKEFGDEALLVDSRPTSGAELRLGAYEVIFEGHPVGDEPAVESAVEATQAPLALAPPRGQDPGQFAQLRSELDRLSILVAQMASTNAHLWPELVPEAAALNAADVPTHLVQSLLDRVERRLDLRQRPEPVPQAAVRRALSHEIESVIEVDPSVGRPRAQRRIVALVGPAGAGKTTTLVKLAMQLGVATRRPSLILSTDTCRIAAADQLRSLSAILGLPFQVADSPSAMVRALEEHRQKELIFIDTPGFGPRESETATEWAELLAAHPDIETQLVLPATTRTADLLAASRQFALFHPSKLIFTHLDETRAAGGCLAAAVASGLPVSFLCAGQTVPEDLEPASKARILELVLGGSPAARSAAA